MLAVAIILMLLPVVINLISIQVAARVNNVAVFTEIIGTVVFGVLLLVLWGVRSKPTPYGAGILINTTSVTHNPTWYAFALAGLLGAFTLVGFELAADMSEDAVNPGRSVPRGVLWAVGGSAVLGMVALIGFTVAIPDLKAVESAPLPLLAIAAYWLPSWLVKVFVAFVVFSMFAILVVGSGAQARLVYSLSRDNMLPFSGALRKINPRSQTPVTALLVFAVIDVGVMIYGYFQASAFGTLVGATAIIPYIIYFLITVAYAVKRRTTDSIPGAFTLGRWAWPVIGFVLAYTVLIMVVLSFPAPFHGSDKMLGYAPGAGRAVVLRRPAAAAEERHGRGQAGKRPRRPALTASPPGGTRAWRGAPAVKETGGRALRVLASRPGGRRAAQPCRGASRWRTGTTSGWWKSASAASRVTWSASSPTTAACTRSSRSTERLARREYRLLRALAESGVPAVEVVGVAVDLGPDADAVLVTKFLTYATTYRAVFSSPRGAGPPADKLLDALVELLVRLHLSGFFWGDCSLSNTLFRYDAGALKAYFLDAETSEQHAELSDGLRRYDVELAVERIFGELLDLQAGDLLPADLDPLEVAEGLSSRYERLWHELTREEVMPRNEQRFRIEERLRRLNELGFAAEEVELISTPDGSRLRVHTRVAEAGDHQPQALPADRHRRGREPGPPAAQRHRLLPRVPGAEGRPPGIGDRRGQPVARRGLRPRCRVDSAGPARTPGPGGGLPRDPRAPLVHVGAGRPRRRHHRGRPLLLPARAAPGAGAAGREHRLSVGRSGQRRV